MKNKYAIRSRISEKKFREILKYFCLDLEAVKISKLTGVSEQTLAKYFRAIRERISEICENEAKVCGEIEVDESYFGPRRQKGKRGRGAVNKTIVFGLYKRNGKVYTEIVPDTKKSTLQAVIRGRVNIESVIHSDGWRGDNGLVDLGYKKHFRVHHRKNEFVRGKSHINGIENFWGLAKVRLSRFRGIHKHTFYLHLKETEFRFNYRHQSLYDILLKNFRSNPLNFN